MPQDRHALNTESEVVMSDKGGIIRTQKDKDHPYKVLNMAFATNPRLSLEAKGLLVYLLSKPDNWRVRVPDLMKQCNIGRDKAYRILKELEDNGHLQRSQEHVEAGRFAEQIITIYEAAQPVQTSEQLPLPEKPHTVKPDTDQPHTVNQDLNKYVGSTSKDVKQIGRGNAPATQDAPPQSEQTNDTDNRKYPQRKDSADYRQPAKKTAWPGYDTLPDDWQHYGEQTRPELNIDAVFASFRDYCIANGTRYVNWLAAWQRWVRETTAKPHLMRNPSAKPTNRPKLSKEEQDARLLASRIGISIEEARREVQRQAVTV